MLIEFLTVILGIIIILVLAEITIRSALKLGDHHGWSGSFVGLTILSIGTSIPEIMSAIIGSINITKVPSTQKILSGLIIGQNVGSDIFQQSFVLSVVALIGTIVVVKKDLFKEMGGLILGAVLFLLLSADGIVSRIDGLILVASYIFYLVYLYVNRKRKKISAKYNLTQNQVSKQILIIIISFIIMALVADKVLNSSENLVASLPISASFFGVILLGVASALPEFTTALIGIIKKKKGVSAGVLIGSNITNPLLGLGLGSLISSYMVPKVTIVYDLPFKIGTALLIGYFLLRNQRIEKKEAISLIILFFAYLYLRNMYFPIDF
tara:strand:+ start:225 stop:1196 length:972 start_codon:yes stop_codon:yes gene_type:complete